MQNTRRMRLQAVIQAELAQVISREVKDPRVPPLTITAVEVTPDGGQATLLISLLGEGLLPEPEAQKRMKDCLTGLTSAAGYLRRHLARVLNVRHIPSLIFREDRGYENAIRVQELLKKISPDTL